MNQRTGPRIHRRESPPVMQGRAGYRKAEPHLRRDFDYRCAYCSTHELQMGGPQAFCIDHFKPRSKGGKVNEYTNLYWVCIPCNMIKHDKWPTREQRRKGYRFADPCSEQEGGVHFVESDDGLLHPLTACGEYHVSMLRLNRTWLQQHRRERTHKWSRLNEANQLMEGLAQVAEANSEEVSVQIMQRLFLFLSQEIRTLQSELELAIPLIPSHIL